MPKVKKFQLTRSGLNKLMREGGHTWFVRAIGSAWPIRVTLTALREWLPVSYDDTREYDITMDVESKYTTVSPVRK
jgi:hypothetical protein